MSLTVSVAEWLERIAWKEGVACSFPGGGIWHAKVTKSRETMFHSRKLGFALDKLGLSRIN